MRKEQFEQKHQHLNIPQTELDRKWRVLQEDQKIFEALQQQAAAQGLAGGGAADNTGVYGLIVPNNDFYYNFS